MTLKLTFATYMAWHLSVGWAKDGWPSVFWVCGLGLEALFLAVVFESPLLATAALIGAVPAQSVWASDLLAGFFLGTTPFNYSDWMFNPSVDLEIKIRTLYHVWAPPLTLWLVYRTYFHERARELVLLGAVPLLLLSVWIRSIPESGMVDNFNLVETPEGFPPALWLLVLYSGYAALTLTADATFRRLFSDQVRTFLASLVERVKEAASSVIGHDADRPKPTARSGRQEEQRD